MEEIFHKLLSVIWRQCGIHNDTCMYVHTPLFNLSKNFLVSFFFCTIHYYSSISTAVSSYIPEETVINTQWRKKKYGSKKFNQTKQRVSIVILYCIRTNAIEKIYVFIMHKYIFHLSVDFQVFPGRAFHSLASLSTEVPILSCSGLTKRYVGKNVK